jgi:hypothetical protein
MDASKYCARRAKGINMKQTIPARTIEGGLIEPHHEIEVVCSACGYDLDEAE